MKLFNLLIWLIGIGLIVFLCFLVSGAFEDKKILFLDGLILVISYTLALYVYGALFVSQEKFASEVPSTGVKLFALWAYDSFAILCIVFGYAYKLSFGWQLFLQACFLFFFIIGLIVSNASIERLTVVANKSQEKHASVDTLLAMAQQLKLSASLNNSLNPEIQKEISTFAERMGYVSPSKSQAAIMQEDMLRSSIGHLSALMQSNDSLDQLIKELENAKTILSQRIKTY